MIPSARDMFQAAGHLVRQGQPVFPCKSRGPKAKAPLTQNGLKDATTDKERIRQWWRSNPTAALGIPTGIVWDVLDVDVKHGSDGRVHLPYLQRMGLLNGCLRVILTPSGGYHLYFPAAPGLTNKANATLGLDMRGRGGYVLAAPSFLDTDEYAGAYVDMGETEGNTGEPLLWDLIVSALTPVNAETRKPIAILPSERRASIAALREWVSTLKSGERNNGLHWAVCRCIDNGIDPHELVEPAMLTGLLEDEILLTVNSALKRAGVIAEELDTEAEAMFPEEMDTLSVAV